MDHTKEELQIQLEELRSKMSEIQNDLNLKNEVLENSLNGFDVVDSQGRIIYANKTYLKMWGYQNLDEVIGTSASDHCMDPSIPRQIIESIQKTGECSIEFKARRKDGSYFDVQMWARKAINGKGQELYPTTSIDVSYRNTTEERLKAAISARDEFLSIASHELKTPLSALKLRNQMLLRKLKKEQEIDSKVLEIALTDNDVLMNRITQQIEDMLDISRLNSGRFTLNFEQVSVRDVLNKAISNFERVCQEEGVSLVLNLNDDAEAVMDPLRMEQVFDNILSNALKYGNRKPITVTSARGLDFMVISVQDSGIGIKEDDQKRIFERYERAISASEVSGMGLGLFISRQIIGMHGGMLEVSSQFGVGSTFSIRIPIK